MTLWYIIAGIPRNPHDATTAPTMDRECISNSLIIKTIQGKGSLISSRVRLPTPRSNEAIIRNSHIAQNTIDGTACSACSACSEDFRTLADQD